MPSALSSSLSSPPIAPVQLYADRYRAMAFIGLKSHLIPDLAKMCLEYATLGEFGSDEWEIAGKAHWVCLREIEGRGQ